MNTDTPDDDEPILFNKSCLIQPYTIDSEAEFLVKTVNALKDNKYVMIKSQDKYANIDFILLNKMNLCSVLIELKRKKINGNSYQDFFIGYNKLIALDTFYHSPIYLVFECDDNTWWVEYDSSFLTRDKELVRGSNVIRIRKEECGLGFNKLISQLKNSLNI